MKMKWIHYTNRTLVLTLIIIAMTSIGLLAGYAKSRTDKGENPAERLSPNDLSKVNISNDIKEASPLEEGHGAQLSKAILTVEGMSCSGCIATIKSSLADMKGIKEILVDLVGGKAQIYFDSNVLGNTNQIAEAITSGGYPARVWKVLSPEQIKDEQELAARMSKSYVVSVGEWNISRVDFESELKAAKKRYEKIYGLDIFQKPKGEALLENMRIQIINGLINEGILMQEIIKTDYKLERDDLQNELALFVKKKGISMDKFKKQLEENDYPFNYFMKKFGNMILINRYLDQELLSKVTNKMEKQRIYRDWFNNAKSLNEIVYYDKNLEQLGQSKNAQSSCCTTTGS